jgi:two-component system, LuxR family, sensor kinase FixL
MATSEPMRANGGMFSAELRALLDAAVDAIVVIDEEGLITTFNPAAERMFGYAAIDVLGRAVELLMPEPYRSEHPGYIQRYLASGEARIIGVGREVQGRRANGDPFPIALSVGEARSAGGRHFVGIIRDLTAQRAEEQRLRALEARLEHVGRFNLLGEMAAGIAHEINQPLSAIATYAQAAHRILLRDQPGMTKLVDACRKINEQALRAGQVIENLRKLSRKQEARGEMIDVNQAIADVANLIEADAHAEGIPLRTDFGAELPLVRVDASHLQQVLLNLTRNSVDAMDGAVDKDRGIMVATGRTERGGVRIEVADHGHGVARELGANIFHPFVTTKPEGLGIGLAASRTIVQSYGGTLTYRDNPDGGAIFTIDLPPLPAGQNEP